MTRPSLPRGSDALAALGACLLAAVLISRRLLRPDVVSDDALVHQYWLWHVRDPQLFNDPLTADLRRSSRYPDGYELVFRLASHVVDPIAFGEWVGVVLMALSGWLVFLIVREHTDWRPAAWIAGALFLALIDIGRFHGGFPRAFVHPVVLLTVLLAMKRRDAAAALVAGGGALFYPPAALLAAGVLLASALRWPPRVVWRRAAYGAAAVVLAAACVLVPQLFDGAAPRVFSADGARAFPEFGPHGTLHFFASSTLDYLRQNRSGFDLRATGSIVLLAALALLAARRGNLRLLRPEVLALPVVSLAAYGLAQAVLFRLYLPHRYTYPLVAFAVIAIGVTLRPTWEGAARPRAVALVCAPLAVAAFAVWVFPLGPVRAPELFRGWWLLAGAVLAVAVGTVRPAAATGALVTGALLLALVLAGQDGWARGNACPTGPVVRYLGTLPKDAVIAGDPNDLKCLPMTARRAVVISTQLAPAYEVEYFLRGRARMFADLRAVYGPSAEAIVALRTRYGATHLWIRRGMLEAGGARWRPGRLPYGRYVRGLVAQGRPAALSLPAACRTFRRGTDEVYAIACLAGS